MKKKVLAFILSVLVLGAVLFTVWGALLLSFPRPYPETVEGSGVEPSLVYAIIRAESGYRENAVSRAGAVGLMQVKPSTAEYLCRREGIVFEEARLTEGEYNITVGTKYLLYLFSRFADRWTALAAYNAGEGTVSAWLADGRYSKDGVTLKTIPFPETEQYVKKIRKFRKIYEILY